jgi:WD40-like Beta Propeller Repeat
VVVYTRSTPAHDGVPTNADIYINCNGQNLPLTATPGNELNAAISGDGKTVAWDDDMQSGMTAWRVCKWNNGQVTPLTDGRLESRFPFIASDTGQVFFEQFKGDRVRIAGEQPDGKVAPVVEGTHGILWPDVSADGRVFTWAAQQDDISYLERYEGGQVTTAQALPGVDFTWSRSNADATQQTWTAFDRTGPDSSDPPTSLLYSDGKQTYTLAHQQGSWIPAMADISKDGSTVAWFGVDSAGTGAKLPTQVWLFEKDARPAT